jgi:phosphoribosylanthranilate isomerase
VTRVKICGISDVKSAIVASESGADFLGFVFAASPRRVVPAEALSIITEIRSRKFRLSTVGVFVDTPAEEVNRIAEYCRLDFIQLSGNESWVYCLNIKLPVIKVIHVAGDMTSQKIIDEIVKGNEILTGDIICLLDTKVGETYGGTGNTFDWHLAKVVSEKFPVLVAGGLNPENVGTLTGECKPWGVDVSSGVETNGKKDEAKIRDFIREVKNTSQ